MSRFSETNGRNKRKETLKKCFRPIPAGKVKSKKPNKGRLTEQY